MASDGFRLPDWDSKPLNQFLKRILPGYITPYQRLDVERLRADVVPSRSHEAVYKWLRKSKLTPENARALIELANRQGNLDARGGTYLTLRDFDPFVYPAET